MAASYHHAEVKWANSKKVNWPEDKRAAIIGRMITEGKVVLVEGGGEKRKGKERETGIARKGTSLFDDISGRRRAVFRTPLLRN